MMQEVDVIWAVTSNGHVTYLFWTEEQARAAADRFNNQGGPYTHGLCDVKPMAIEKRSPSGGEDPK